MYQTLAHYYDQLHAGLTEDLPLILALAQGQGSPVLELGCGSGRLLLPLARAGIEVTGVDNSPAMLALARARLAAETPQVAARVTLLAGDMRNLPVAAAARLYPLIAIPYNTLLHFSRQEAAQVLRPAARLLAPRGALFLDLVNPFLFDNLPQESGAVLEAELVDAETGAVVEQWSTMRVDAAAQTVQVRWTFRTTAAPPSTELVEMTYHYLFPHELELLLHRSGLRLAELWGDYDRRPFDSGSERLLAVATRAAP